MMLLKPLPGTGHDRIVTKGLMGSAVTKRINFRILIQCKDSRYKYTISNFQLSFKSAQFDRTFALEDEKGFKNKFLTKKQTLEVYEDFKVDMNNLIANLKKSMASESESTKDW